MGKVQRPHDIIFQDYINRASQFLKEVQEMIIICPHCKGNHSVKNCKEVGKLMMDSFN